MIYLIYLPKHYGKGADDLKTLANVEISHLCRNIRLKYVFSNVYFCLSNGFKICEQDMQVDVLLVCAYVWFDLCLFHYFN